MKNTAFEKIEGFITTLYKESSDTNCVDDSLSEAYMALAEVKRELNVIGEDHCLLQFFKYEHLKAKEEVRYWERFINDYQLIAGNQTSTPISKASSVGEYSNLKIAGMNKSLELAKDIIQKHGTIKSARQMLEYFAVQGFTEKKNSLAAYLSQVDDFTYDKKNGGWSLAQKTTTKERTKFL